MMTLAGAMSTAEIGRSLAPAIRTQKVHAICCTGANLEEELFGLISRSSYEEVSNWRDLSPHDDAALRDRGMNRITDVAIPEEVFRDVVLEIVGSRTSTCMTSFCTADWNSMLRRRTRG